MRIDRTNDAHGLINREHRGPGYAECKCGERSQAQLASRNERRAWQQHHRDQVNLRAAQDKRRSYWVMLEAGVTYRQLDSWVRRGYLRPDSKSGKESDRVWQDEEMFVAVEMGRLTRAGFMAGAAAEIARRHVEHPSATGAYTLELGIDIQFVN